MKKRVLSSVMLVAFLISIMSFTVAHAAEGKASVTKVKPDDDKTVSVADEVYVEFDGEPDDTALAALKVYKWNDETGSFAQETDTFKKSVDYKYVYGGTLSADATYKVEWDGGNRIFHTMAGYMPQIYRQFLNVSFDDYESGYNKTGNSVYNMIWGTGGDYYETAAKIYNENNRALSLKNNGSYKMRDFNSDNIVAKNSTVIISFEYYFPDDTVSTTEQTTRIGLYAESIGGGNSLTNNPFFRCNAGAGGTTTSVSIFGSGASTGDLKKAAWNKVDMRITVSPLDGEDKYMVAVGDVYFNGKNQNVVTSKVFDKKKTGHLDELGYVVVARTDWPNKSDTNTPYLDNILIYNSVDAVKLCIDEEATAGNNYSLTANKSLFGGRVYITGGGNERKAIGFDYTNEGKTIVPVIPKNLDKTGYILEFEGFKNMLDVLPTQKYIIGTGPVIYDMSLSSGDGTFVPKVGETVDLTATVKVSESELHNEMIFAVAEYDGNKLMQIKAKKLYAQESEETLIKSLDVSINNPTVNTVIKMFLWNSNMRPVYSSAYNYYETQPAKLHLVGDSICATYGAANFPQTGVGDILQEFFENDLEVVNYSRGGRSTRDFLSNSASPTWDEIKANIAPGDYVMVILGINDSNGAPERFVPESEYKSNLKQFIDDTRAMGGNIIIGTQTYTAWSLFNNLDDGLDFLSVYENDAAGSTQEERTIWAKSVAEANDVVVLDLFVAVVNDIDKLYAENISQGYDHKTAVNNALSNYYLNETYFASLPADKTYYKNSTILEQGHDLTHLNRNGAVRLCNLICSLLKDFASPLARYLK